MGWTSRGNFDFACADRAVAVGFDPESVFLVRCGRRKLFSKKNSSLACGSPYDDGGLAVGAGPASDDAVEVVKKLSKAT